MSLKRSNEGYDELQRKKIRLQSECNILSLPDELVIKIFSYLRYTDLLMGAALVCTEWRRLTLDSELWNRINESDGYDTLTKCFDDNLIKNEADFWNIVNQLKKLPEVTTESVIHLLNQSKYIKYIRLHSCNFIEDSVISEISKQEMLRTLILSRCDQLTPAIFGSVAKCRALQHLDLSELPLTNETLGMIAESCTKLTYLGIEGCLGVTTTGLLPVFQHCTNLKHLILNHCKNLMDDCLMAMAAARTQIERLEIADCGFTAKGLKYLRMMPQLKHVDVSKVYSICDSMVHMFANLKCLRLNGLEYITNDGVVSIVHNNPNLEQLVLGSTQIDNIAMEYISNSPCRSTLTLLDVEHCLVDDVGISLILQNCTKLKTVIYYFGPEKEQKRLQLEYPNVKIILVNP